MADPIIVPRVRQQGAAGTPFVQTRGAQDPGGGIGTGLQTAGRGLTAAGQVLANAETAEFEAQRRVQAREDALQRAVARQRLETSLAEANAEAEANDTFADPRKITDYRTRIRQMADNAMLEFGDDGLQNNAPLFAETVAEIHGGFDRAAISKGVEVGRTRLDQTLVTEASRRADLVRSNPSVLGDQQQLLLGFIERDYRPGAAPEREGVAVPAAMSMLSQAALDFHLASNDFKGAQKLMADPSVLQFLTDTQKRQNNIKIVAGLVAAEEQKRHILPAGAVMTDNDGKVLARGGATTGSISKPVILKPGEVLVDAKGTELARGPEISKRHVLGPGEVLIENGEVVARGEGQTFTLGPGQRVVDPKGREIAKGNNQTFTLSPGQRVLDADGQELARGSERVTILGEDQIVIDESGKKIAEGRTGERRLYTLQPGESLVTETGKEVANKEPESLFGGKLSAQARNVANLVDMAEAFKEGLLSPAEEAQFLGLANAVQTVNPVTGERIDLPLPVRDALIVRGIDPARIGSNEGVPAFRNLGATRFGADLGQDSGERLVSTDEVEPAAAAEPGVTEAAEAAPLTAEQQTQVRETIAEGVRPLAQVAAEVLQVATGPDGQPNPRTALEEISRREINFFREAESLTGLIGSFRSFARNIPFVGRVFQESREIRGIRQMFRLVQPLLSPVFRATDRFADAQRKDLQQALTAFESRPFSEPEALRDDIIGLDGILAVMEANARETLDKEGSVSAERRNQFLDDINRIQLVRKVLGAPPFASTEEEVKQLIKNGTLKVGDRVNYRGEIVVISNIPVLDTKGAR